MLFVWFNPAEFIATTKFNAPSCSGFLLATIMSHKRTTASLVTGFVEKLKFSFFSLSSRRRIIIWNRLNWTRIKQKINLRIFSLAFVQHKTECFRQHNRKFFYSKHMLFISSPDRSFIGLVHRESVMQRSFEEIIHIPFVSQLLLLPKGIISSDAEL